MKERPILFSGPMVRAILDGRKTQTRRVVKPQPDWIRPRVSDDGIAHGYCGSGPTDGIKCPYGTVGDRLWVREAFCQKMEDGRFVYNSEGNLDTTCFHYRADGYHVAKDDGDGGTEYTKSGQEASPWKPSIHMPRWASRIDLEITGIRVERLQEISERDAMAEGVPCEPIFDTDRGIDGKAFPRNEFQSLWNSINGPDSWSANPWVWVVEFKRIKP